jgi:hypothetical protein
MKSENFGSEAFLKIAKKKCLGNEGRCKFFLYKQLCVYNKSYDLSM